MRLCGDCEIEVAPIEIPRPDTPHEAELKCPYCTRFLGWKPKVKNKDKRQTSLTASHFDIDYCQICLRSKDHLGLNETLDIHHIIEIQDNGTDTKDNTLLVCTHCHRLIHHVRTYLNNHLKHLWDLIGLENQDEFSSEDLSGKI